MNQEERTLRRARAAGDFDLRFGRADGQTIVTHLADGLSLLRELFHTRIQQDVVRTFGTDTLLSPISATANESRCKAEIDVFLAIESVEEILRSAQLPCDRDWCLSWLLRLRLGDAAETSAAAQRLAYYHGKNDSERRRAFAGAIERITPEASRAPLVAFRLFPPSAWIATNLAFGQHARANELRAQQIAVLPAIGDCHACHGRVLESGEKCVTCGNPCWSHHWLNSE